MTDYKELVSILNDPESKYPGNFDTSAHAAALLTSLCQLGATAIEDLMRDVAAERERCAKICEQEFSNHGWAQAAIAAAAIRNIS